MGAAGSLALAGMTAAISVVPAAAALATGTSSSPQVPAWAWLVAAAVFPVGVLAGLLIGRHVGVRMDAVGVHPLSLASQTVVAWAEVTDVRTERRRRRTVVVFYLRDGSAVRLRAPYDGGLLGRDPFFDRKMFMIRHVWATHRRARSRLSAR